jgi:Ca-activated chloride channel homolog
MTRTKTILRAGGWLSVAVLTFGFAATGCGSSANSSGSLDSEEIPGGPNTSIGYGTGGAGGSGSGVVAGSGGAYGAGGASASSGASGGGSNVALGGSEDFGYFRRLLDAGQVPTVADFDAGGFFAEHYLPLPPATCGHRVCLQPMLGVMDDLLDGNNMTMLDLGLDSPITANPGDRPPLSLAVAIDVSGSMADAGKIDFVRQGLNLMVDGLQNGDKMALISYSDAANVLFPMGDVSTNRAKLHSIVNGLVAGGGTNFYSGLQAGYKQAQASYDASRQNRVILLSDGEPTEGDTVESDIIQMSRGYNSDGIGLTTIGLGTSFNAELMTKLAEQADGNAYFVEDSGAVTDVFTDELNYFTVPIAYDLKLTLHTGSQYKFGQAYGSSFWNNTADGGTLDVPSLFVAHRTSSSDVTQNGGRRGGGSALLVQVAPKLTQDDGSGISSADVATIDVSYRDPNTNQTVTDTVTVNYPKPPWEVDPQGYFSGPDLADVEKPFMMLNIYLGLVNACRAFYSGVPAQSTNAIAKLYRLIAAATDYDTTANGGTGDLDIEDDASLMLELASVMEANGAKPPVDPAVPSDPWPAN